MKNQQRSCAGPLQGTGTGNLGGAPCRFHLAYPLADRFRHHPKGFQSALETTHAAHHRLLRTGLRFADQHVVETPGGLTITAMASSKRLRSFCRSRRTAATTSPVD